MAGRLRSLLMGRGANIDKATFAANAERLRRSGQLAEAVELCREGLKVFPDQLSARVTLGRALLDLGEYDEARRELEYVVKRAPDNLAAIRGLAQLHDRADSAALLAMESVGDWPPRQEDIDRAVGRRAESPEPAEEVAVRDQGTAPQAFAARPFESSADPIPPSAEELLEEAEILEAIADQVGVSDEPGTLELDDSGEVDLEEIASELTVPVPSGDEHGPETTGSVVPDLGDEPSGARSAGEPIVLDAETLDTNLDDLVDLEGQDGETAQDEATEPGDRGPRPEGATGDRDVNTESALDALERLLNQVKHRRDALTSDSAA